MKPWDYYLSLILLIFAVFLMVMLGGGYLAIAAQQGSLEKFLSWCLADGGTYRAASYSNGTFLILLVVGVILFFSFCLVGFVKASRRSRQNTESGE